MTTSTTEWVTIPERPGRPPTPELSARRNALPAPVYDVVPDVTIDDSPISGVPCRTINLPDARSTIVYLHGGGFRLGRAPSWTAFACRVSRASQARVVLVDYRLAPENPFPAALLDAAAVFDALVAEARHPVFVAGDSAGGNLAAAVTVAASRREAPPAAGLILLSAWTDLRGESATYATRADNDQYFTPAQAACAAEMYLQGHPATDPLASPVLGIASGFPTTLAFASTDEILLGDALDFSRALAEVGTSCSLNIVAGMPHAWTSTAPEHHATATTVDEIGRFVQWTTSPLL